MKQTLLGLLTTFCLAAAAVVGTGSRSGESGLGEDDGTMVCCFELKKPGNDWRICVLVIR